MGEAHHSPTKYVLFLKSDNDTYDNYLQATSVSIRRDERGNPLVASVQCYSTQEGGETLPFMSNNIKRTQWGGETVPVVSM